MKVALLFSGQYRPIAINLLKFSINNLTKNLKYGIFCYAWDEPGESLDHRDQVPFISYNYDSYYNISNSFKDFNLVNLKTEKYQDFIHNLPKKHNIIYNSKNYHKGTIHCLPQIYTLSKCYELFRPFKNEYDLIFRCRFDSLFIHPLEAYPLLKIYNSDALFHINFGRAYYPKRIYDIFFGGSKRSMSFLSDIWEKFPELVNNDFDNKQDKRDACRIIYLGAKLKNIKTRSLNSRICDIYRPYKNNFYEKYLISSHLLSLTLNKNSIDIIIYFLKWLNFRKYNPSQILILVLISIKTFFLIPVAYIKRFRYFK